MFRNVASRRATVSASEWVSGDGSNMTKSPSDNTDHLKVMAGIGGVCVQWALLEHIVLGMIATSEGISLDRAYLMFGSLDMTPRLNMAILLARDAKTPESMVKRIIAVRTTLREKKLADGRNQAVHGVHKDAQSDSVKLTMPRWSGEKRTQVVTVMDLFRLSTRLSELGNDIWLIGDDIYSWKMRMGNNRLEDTQRKFGITNTPILLKITKSLYASGQHFWRNFKG